MTARELILHLQERHILVWPSAEGQTLRLRGDGPPLLPEIREGLKRHKVEVIHLLQDRMVGGAGRYRCGRCWAWFPKAELTSVPERIGRGFRCVDCLSLEASGSRDE